MSEFFSDEQYSASEFVDARFDLPDMGQWAELHSGLIALLTVPDEIHGRIVLNLSKAIAAFITDADAQMSPCFDLGLLMSSDPDTVWFPPLSVFGESRFSHTDEDFTDAVPELVIEIASTLDRRGSLRSRVLAYHERGVATVWVIDPDESQVKVIERGQPTRTVGARDKLVGRRVLTDFSVGVEELFAQPEWYR